MQNDKVSHVIKMISSDLNCQVTEIKAQEFCQTSVRGILF